MQLTLRTSHAMRLLMYCAVNGPKAAPVARIAQDCAMSEAHLAKIAHQLSVMGFVETVRGRRGGVRLARAGRDISVGAVIRATECNPLSDRCDGAPGPVCATVGGCRFRGVLAEAFDAFMQVLDRYSINDLVAGGSRDGGLAGLVGPTVAPDGVYSGSGGPDSGVAASARHGACLGPAAAPA